MTGELDKGNDLTVHASEMIDEYALYIKDKVTLVTNAQKGVGTKLFFDVADLMGYKKSDLASFLDLSTKTIERYTAQHKKLNSLRSEVLLKIVKLYKKGIEVFGSIEAFRVWLNKPAYGLDNMIPSRLMTTSSGIDLIIDEVIRIEFGDLA